MLLCATVKMGGYLVSIAYRDMRFLATNPHKIFLVYIYKIYIYKLTHVYTVPTTNLVNYLAITIILNF